MTNERRKLQDEVLGTAEEVRLEHLAHFFDECWRKLCVALSELFNVGELIRVCGRYGSVCERGKRRREWNDELMKASKLNTSRRLLFSGVPERSTL
jgi:hypothetical protein